MFIIKHSVVIALTTLFIFATIVSETIILHTNGDQLTIRRIDQDQNYNIYSRLERTLNQQAISKKAISLNQDLNIVALKYNDDAIANLGNGLMNSSWPMYCHDTHHTGRSPYNTSNNPLGALKWCFSNGGIYGLTGSSTIGENGTIYLAGYYLFALNPNGTLKWKSLIDGWSVSGPAIDSNGTIYQASAFGDHNYIYAFYPDGSLKWKYFTGNDIYSSPAISIDGTIYIGSGYSIIALYPNGTLRWQYQTGFLVYSSPAIGDDGTVYCGSHDTYLYALCPNNGSLKWRFKTGDWVRVGPCIGADGTIYCVSLDNNLYALRPNGSLKWSTYVGAGTDPTISPDGTIYAGWDHIYAVNPINGSVKWIANNYGEIWGGTPCISNDGIIYYGTSGMGGSGNIVALNSDGTLRWEKFIGNCQSAPSIGTDGTVYIGAFDENLNGFLYAFGQGSLRAEANGPYEGFINQATAFTGTSFGGTPPYTFHWNFKDGSYSEQQNPIHNYTNVGIYNITFTITDNEGNTSTDNATVTVYYPPPTITILKPRNAIYLANIPVCPFFFPLIVGPITIKASVFESAPPGTVGIDHVDFYVSGDLVHTFTHPPYRWMWITFDKMFRNIIEVYAYDTYGHYSYAYAKILRLI